MANPTTNYGWTLPVVGGSQDAWGTILNTMAQDIDDDLDAVETTADQGVTDAAAAQATADAALPADGGTLVTGLIGVDDQTTSGAIDLDLSAANWFTITLNGNQTALTASNVPATANVAVVVIVDITLGGYTWASWAGLGTIEWAGGSAPTLNGHDVIMLVTYDGGSNWQGSVIQKNLS